MHNFSYAFDSVFFPKHLNKLTANGIDGHYLLWLGGFLINSTIRIKKNDCLSDEIIQTSEVPLSSIFAPICFVLIH